MNIRVSGLAVALAALYVGSSGDALAQAGSGKAFGTHDPRTCASKKGTGNGITAAQAKEYFICEHELTGYGSGGDTILVVSDVTVEVGKGRPFAMSTDAMTDIDVTATVYPIRGSFKSWRCNKIGAMINGTAGKNCLEQLQPNSKGYCYRSSFGDWQCNMDDGANSTNFNRDVAPPTGA